MLGVYADDEMEVLSSESRTFAFRNSTPAKTPPAPPPAATIAAPVKSPPPPTAPASEVPAPIGEASAGATGDDAFDSEKYVIEFREAAEAAQDASTLQEAFDDIITPVADKMFPPDIAVCERIMREHGARLAQ